ncbi:hypothetical protein LXA43DRAFT_1057194 [Ganoderma leucocontextum]|nr:hypothetical protein LXA43DRAFT_1057194 [Ganoderma leucocontextum]
MSTTPPCTVILHVAGDADFPDSPALPSRLPAFSPRSPSRFSSANFLAPPGPRPYYGRRRPSLNDYYPQLRPAWTPAPGEDPDSDTIALVPLDSLHFDPDFDSHQPWHKRWKAKARATSKSRKAKGSTRWEILGHVLFFSAVVAIVVLQGLVFLVKVACLPFALQH